MLKAVIAKLEDVAENLRSLYVVGGDGRFYLNVTEGVDELPAVRGTVTKNKELLDKLALVKDIDPTEYARLKQLANDTDKKKGTDKDVATMQAEFDSKMKQASELHATELGAERAASRGHFLNAEVTRAVTAKKGRMKFLGHEVEKALKVERTEKGYVLHVLKADGTPRIKDGAGTPFTVDDLVDELKANPEYGPAFDGSGSGGSGADGNPGGGVGSKVIAHDDAKGFSANFVDIARRKAVVK